MKHITQQFPTNVGTATIEAPIAYEPARLSFTGAAFDTFNKAGPFFEDWKTAEKLQEGGWSQISVSRNTFHVDIPNENLQLVMSRRTAQFIACRSLEYRNPLIKFLTDQLAHITDVTDCMQVIFMKHVDLQRRVKSILLSSIPD